MFQIGGDHQVMILEPLGSPYTLMMVLIGFLAFIDALCTRKYRLVYLVLIYALAFLLIYDAITNIPAVFRSALGILLFMPIILLIIPVLVYLSFLEYEVTGQPTSRYRKTLSPGIMNTSILYYVFSIEPKATIITLSIPVIIGVVFFFHISFLWFLYEDAALLSESAFKTVVSNTLMSLLIISPIATTGLFFLGINVLWKLYGSHTRGKQVNKNR